MKILILTSQVSQGSAELLSIDLARDLSKLNQKIVLVSLQSFSKENKPCDHLIRDENIKILSLNIKPKANIFKVIASIIKLRKILFENNIDIIETSSPTLASIAALTIFRTKIKLLSGLHETFYKGRNRIKGGNTNSIRKRIYAIITRPSKNIYFYAVSNYVKKTWINYSRINSKRIRVIYDAIEIQKK